MVMDIIPDVMDNPTLSLTQSQPSPPPLIDAPTVGRKEKTQTMAIHNDGNGKLITKMMENIFQRSHWNWIGKHKKTNGEGTSGGGK